MKGGEKKTAIITKDKKARSENRDEAHMCWILEEKKIRRGGDDVPE